MSFESNSVPTTQKPRKTPCPAAKLALVGLDLVELKLAGQKHVVALDLGRRNMDGDVLDEICLHPLDTSRANINRATQRLR